MFFGLSLIIQTNKIVEKNLIVLSKMSIMVAERPKTAAEKRLRKVHRPEKWISKNTLTIISLGLFGQLSLVNIILPFRHFRMILD